MSGGSRPSERRSYNIDRIISHVLASLLVALGLILLITVPRVTNERITLEVTCTSGAPVVGLWLEASLGGSGWGEPADSTTPSTKNYGFILPFGGSYEAHVGCGGNRDRWEVNVKSDRRNAPQRRLMCHDRANEVKCVDVS